MNVIAAVICWLWYIAVSPALGLATALREAWAFWGP